MAAKMQDIDIFLQKNPEILNAIHEAQSVKIGIYSEEVDFYHDMFLEYNKFITKLAKLLKSLNLSTSLEYSIATKYLIDGGYLSKDMKFYPKEPKNELETNCGPNIIVGNGVCRNYADFHYDVMNSLGEYSKRFFCTKSFSLKKAQNMRANHVLCLIKHNDVLYGIDLANGAIIYKFINSSIMTSISFTENDRLLYKPYFEMIAEIKSFAELTRNIKIFEEDSKKEHIPPIEYYDDILPSVTIKLAKEKDAFEDFHNETKDIKDNVVEAMSRKRAIVFP